jgi:hypothetical protein
MLGVTEGGMVEIIVSAAAPPPRRDLRRRSRLVAEHQRRLGDPAQGGSSRAPIMTAYRQQALSCAALMRQGPQRPRDLRSRIPDAGKILLHNVYGWFAREARGLYSLTEAGHSALERWPQPDQVAGPIQPKLPAR